MADKRMNKAERREEAKQRREQEMRRRARARAMKKARMALYAVAIVGAIVALVLFNSARGRQARQELNTLASAAGCGAIQTPPDQGSSHLTQGQTFDYNSDPPTSGNHDPAPGPTGISTQPIPDRNQVHNLEHGHVGIQYSGERNALTDKLEKVVRSNPTRIFLAPRPTMKARVAFTAWGHLMICDNPTDDAVKVARDWVKVYAGKGPEGDRPSQNTIGV